MKQHPPLTYNANAMTAYMVSDTEIPNGELGKPWTAELDGAWFAPHLEVTAKHEADYKRLAAALLEAQAARKHVTIEVDSRTYFFVPERVEIVHGYDHTIRIWFAPDDTDRSS